MYLTFDEDLGRRPENPDKDNKVKNKKNKKRNNRDESGVLQESDKKKNRQELLTRMREEVFSCSHPKNNHTLDLLVFSGY